MKTQEEIAVDYAKSIVNEDGTAICKHKII